MKGDGRAAAYGHWGRATGHQVVIARSVIILLVGYRTHHGVLVESLGQMWYVLAEADTGHRGLYGSELALDPFGGIRFWVEGFVVTGATVEPNENTANVFYLAACSFCLGAKAKEIGQAQTSQCPHSDLKKISTSQAIAVPF
jgi:hypothetical protein